jgi:hypothetical protein
MGSGTYESIDARFNWWGEATTAVMNTGGNPKNIDKIYDRFDDGNLSLVNYAGWLDGPVDPTRPPAPTPLLPEDAATGLFPEVTFAWSTVANATSYKLQVSTSNTFASIALEQDGIADTLFTVISPLSFGTRYFWRVQAVNDNGAGSWSAVANFRTVDLNLVENTFSAALTVKDASNISKDVIIGANAAATNSFDSEFDQLAPPQPPIGVFDVRLLTGGNDYLQDFRSITEVSTQWRLKFSPSGSAWPVKISWDPSQLAKGGLFTMRDAITGQFVNVDMRTSSEAVIEFEFITEVIITHTMRYELTRHYHPRWNIVSLPVTMEHTNYQEVFKSARSNSMFGFNNTYFTTTTFEPGNGYWVFMDAPDTIRFAGVPIEMSALELASGWNLITGLSYPTSVTTFNDPAGIIIPGTLFGFNGTYQSASVLNPGSGYWIRTNNSGVVSLQSTGSGMAKEVLDSPLALRPAEQLMQNHHRITLVDNARPDDLLHSNGGLTSQGVQLFFGAALPDGVSPTSFSLPPLPPAGTFDARFADDMYASNNSRVEVFMQRTDADVTLKVQSASDLSSPAEYRIREYMGPVELVNTELNDATNWLLHPLTSHFVIENMNAADLPADFSLGQNYPNPFNPTTIIRYALPVETHVRIELYTVLGQRVSTLVNDARPAGWHTLTVDGSNLSSGVYIYRINAAGFSETRKMILVK